MYKVAVMIDGSFFRKRLKDLKGSMKPLDEAKFLHQYCFKHLEDSYVKEPIIMYRIFYYDSMPSEKEIVNPLTGKTENLAESKEFFWMHSFYDELKKMRKVALRTGDLSDSDLKYVIKPMAVDRLIKANKNGKRPRITKDDIVLNIRQKGVDMKLGIDIASLSYKHQVDKIVLIAGDSDFVPAAKLARREGVDFVLDPMWNPIKDNLFEHIDGMKTIEEMLPKPSRIFSQKNIQVE